MDEYGIFNDEGLLESDFYSKEDAETALQEDYPEEVQEDADRVERGEEPLHYVARLCHDHPDQPAHGCEECDEEEDDEDEEEDGF